MKLYISQIDKEIPFLENFAQVLIIEKRELFSDILMSFWKQCNGEEGTLILSEDDKLLSLNKKSIFIINPFALDCNEKKVINYLYKELERIISEKFTLNFLEQNGNNIRLIEQINDVSPYPLDYNIDIGVVDFLKLYNVKLQIDEGTLLEKIIDYIRTYHRICGISLFIFVNLKLYLSEIELHDLYEFMFYEKVFSLDLEGNFIAKNENEHCIIVDKDLCIINLD
ncbi:MAG: type II-A CRISPR-associated protein Csn2 [Lachnospiraceae bacterium]|nr:type II-A CRISPR-associated protein Csn2 [Lachnospiraceae bacterium]